MNRSTLNTIVNSLNFIPEHISEYDLEEFLYSENIDILLHKSQLVHLLDILEIYNKHEIEGDIVECGVWKGATAAILKSSINLKYPNRKMHLFDFFGQNISLDFNKLTIKEKSLILKIDGKKVKLPSIEKVKILLGKFNLLDDSVNFIQGDIIKTTQMNQIDKISILHLDLDFFYTTDFVLKQFYNKVSKGGIILINDYNLQSLDCKKAVDNFMNKLKIKNKLVEVGTHIAYWIKK